MMLFSEEKISKLHLTIKNEMSEYRFSHTAGVVASAESVGQVAENTAVVVKATQNVLIGVVAFFIALYLSTRSKDRATVNRPSLSIVWEKFPKFILGFLFASALFSIMHTQDLLHSSDKTLAKNFSTFFFSLSFVCIGMDTRLKDIVSRENRRILHAFLGTQLFNIIVTGLIAWVVFGIIKPLL